MLPHKIVAFGSSSLAGVGDPENGGFMRRLKKWHEANDFRNLLYNLGISGDTTTQMVKRIKEEAILRKPGLIIIASGLNDTRRVGSKDAPKATSITDFKKNINELIKVGKNICDVVFISVYPIDDSKTAPLLYWSKDYYYFNSSASEYSQYVKEICKNEKIPYCDVFDEWMQWDYKKWLKEDGLHANAVGHERIYTVLKDFLSNLYKEN